ncbi:GNAT family N-acetyltransferase [Paenibacillus doosanensis]|uniref:GNAT family N-acetyltransferase n=1 Tax=Paenibacillus doosanensis TaxID=1229154 RepID=UPI00217FC94D|nr:GNAT family N-acetyltransferase [Paenibacillus doosanensis]MCS7459128.1 GNAT family N-acetyltransferase [Paenibacillus doosanensis]
MLQLVEAAVHDETFLLELYVSTRSEEVSGWGWGTEEIHAFLAMQFQFRQKSYASRYAEAKPQLVMQDGRRIGVLLVARETGFIVLVDIALLPDAQNRGTGTALLQLLQEEAQASGRPILLHVQSASRAKSLYERLGFRTTKAEGVYDEMQWKPTFS